MKRILLLFLSVSALLFPLHSAVNSGDLVYLYDFLEKNHPDFYNSLSESEARAILDEEKAKTERKRAKTGRYGRFIRRKGVCDSRGSA